MSDLVIIHITPASLFKLSIHICVYTNYWDIFLIRQEFIYSCSGPLGIPCWGGNASCKEHINNFPQAGSGKIILNTVSDIASALYRASYIPHDTTGARRSIRVLVTRHTGSGRFCPCRIKHRVQISCEICLVLLRISTQIVKKRSARSGYHPCPPGRRRRSSSRHSPAPAPVL